MALHERLQKTNIPFEMVIVGPVEPTFELPEEIKYIKSKVKPSQCFHAAGMLTTGSVMLQLVDDLEYSDGSIEKMYDVVTQHDNVTATPFYYKDNKNTSADQNIAGCHYPHSYLPYLPVCGMFRKKAWIDHKGLDRRFDGIMGELDFYMRICMNGYRTVFVDGIVNENMSYQTESVGGLSQRYWVKDRSTFNQLWTTNNVYYPIRNDIVREYDISTVLTVDQFFN
jgi:hypothetical protein